MIKRLTIFCFCLLLAIGGSIVAGTASKANAASCSDVDLVFARGTQEVAAPMGVTGISFTQALRATLGGKTVASHAVNYAASADFNNRLSFARSVLRGVHDAQNQVTAIAKRCPASHIVLGGYSQGATVAGYAATGGVDVPPKYRQYADTMPKPLPADVAKHVSSVVLFAAPSKTWNTETGAPSWAVGQAFASRTLNYCVAGDTVCDGAKVQQPNALHVTYAINGMTLDAAGKVRARV